MLRLFGEQAVLVEDAANTDGDQRADRHENANFAGKRRHKNEQRDHKHHWSDGDFPVAGNEHHRECAKQRG
ncbi:hypothetical protein SDC9_71244 [bioreactor metagenome]|uniref:Uncharacterized protein n=1 Tax=bioreactor metagenome TaxID=1076179 RepID=A0A644Y8X6_9ZZZZ